MKPTKPSLFVIAASALMLLAGSAFAQTNAYDDAYHYTKANWNTTNAPYNGGFGFTPWVLTTNGPGSHSFFTTHSQVTTPYPSIASPTNFSSAPGNDTNQHVFGVYANGTGANMSVAYRGFSNSLTTNVVFKIQFQSDGIGNYNTNQGGFVLRNGNSTNGVTDLTTNFRFQFYYIGGGANSFVYWDGSGVNTIGIPFTSAGLECELTLEANDTYHFVVKNVTNNVILAVLDGQPLNGTYGSTIDSVAIFAKQTSANQEFNRLQIVSTSLTPPVISNIIPTNGSIFVAAGSSNVSFEVDTATSTLSSLSNNVILLLNGVSQTNLSFNTNGATQQLLVTNNAPLTPNTAYTGVIIVTDANNNQATNIFTFNTWLATDPYIEAEDYNYNGGMFISLFPDADDAYANLLGTNSIDYNVAAKQGTNNAYRPGDLPQIQVTGDVDHAGYANSGYTDYNLSYVDTGDWENYTRVLDGGTYNVYARVAGFGTGPLMEMDRLASATALTTNQPRTALGLFTIPSTATVQTYTFVPLSDLFGNPVAIQFPGTNTFRFTSVGGDRTYNFNYVILVANTNTAVLRPYISTGSPATNATGVGLDAAVSFSIANRQTSLNPSTVQVFFSTTNGTTNVTSSLVVSNNAAGASYSYTPPAFLLPNTTYTVKAIFADMGGTNVVTTTNSWTFTTVNQTNVVIPVTNALPASASAGLTPGFALTIYKIDNSAPTTSTISNAELELAGLLTNTATGAAYPNLASNNGVYSETNELNYDITGGVTATPAFPYKSAFPDLAASNVDNNFALQALTYLQLNTGNYVFAVRSDDGFKLTSGPTPANTNTLLGLFDGGRGNTTPTLMYVTVLTNGLYPVRLLYFQAGSGGNLEFYSITNGTAILINDPTNALAIKAFQPATTSAATPVTILQPAYNAGTFGFSFVTQSGHTHYVEYKTNLLSSSWTPLQTIVGTGSTTNVTDGAAGGVDRFYRVRTQ